jgi:hypothetical protein
MRNRDLLNALRISANGLIVLALEVFSFSNMNLAVPPHRYRAPKIGTGYRDWTRSVKSASFASQVWDSSVGLDAESIIHGFPKSLLTS